MSSKETSKKTDFFTKAQGDIPYLYMVKSAGGIHCDECENLLGIWRMVRHALFKRKGSTYFVPCKKCKHVNNRVKGEIGKHLDGRWDDEKSVETDESI